MRIPLICLLALVNLASVALAEAPLDQLKAQLDSLANGVWGSYRASGSKTDNDANARTHQEDAQGRQVLAKGGLIRAQAAAGESKETLQVQRVRYLVQQSQGDVTYLQGFVGARTLPASYRESLEANNAALGGISSYVGSPTSRDLVILEAVAADLRTKADHARLASATYDPAGAAPFPVGFEPIAVAVHTRKENKEVSGYEVWFAPAAFGDGSRDRRFDRYSSPTAGALAPGNYYLWARSVTDGSTGQRQLFSIGKGQTSHEIDIAAP